MTEVAPGSDARSELSELRQQVRDLAAAQDALLRRLRMVRLAVLRVATGATVLCLLLAFVLPAFDEKLTSYTDSAIDDQPSSPVRLVQLPFVAFGPSAPGETSNGRVLDIVMGVGFTGLLIVAIGVVVALLASWEGPADGWPRWCARALSVLLLIGSAVVLLIGLAGSLSGGAIHWSTLILLALGAVLAALLLLTDVRRAQQPGKQPGNLA